ncbi:MAG: outer membrane transport family protein [Micavibrio aeruginosavorus]|uniref:Outer membrane transport family protein n=1 Tax=Micavibrio aeruginosavorus TaxID=349221 RepID=A0A2W5FFS9_9BACT|nr:MAG: outer membrane transport family protein [Micavibrio aeruginosavorus]
MKNTKIALAAFGALMVSTSAHAAGFYIQEQSVSAGGAAYAGAASNTKDASTIFFNSSGMTKLDGAQGNLGVQLLIPDGKLDNQGSNFPGLGGAAISGGDGGNPYDPTPVPSVYVATPVSAVDGLWVGLGVSAPFGLANQYDSDYFGRFDSIKTELLTMDIQPSVAYKINDRISIGGGLNFQKADANLINVVRDNTSEGTSQLKGDDWGYGYNLGAQIEILPSTTLGLNYRSSIHYDLEGETRVTGLTGLGAGANGITDAHASLVTPDIASIGLSHDIDSKWTVMGQANWMGWNNFGAIAAISDATGATLTSVQQNYQTVWSYALGAEYHYSPEWTFRGGIQYDNTPTTDEFRTTRTPDGDRTWFSTGATYKINDRLSIDGLLTYIHIADEEIDVTRGAGGALNALRQDINADTEGSVGIVGLGLNYKF